MAQQDKEIIMGDEMPKGNYPRIPQNSGGGAGSPEDLERSRAEQQAALERVAARLSAQRGYPVSVEEVRAEMNAKVGPNTK
jgi:hypothetical protein